MAKYEPLRVAFAGCGDIAPAYAKSLATRPKKAVIVGAFDMDAAKTEKFVGQFGGRAYSRMDEMLDDRQVELILNLTSHHAHAEVTCAALQAGKHVHSEKPLAGTLADGRRCVRLAQSKKLRLSCSPFTFMGEAQQTVLRLIRKGRIGKVLAAYSEMNWNRIERWHPNAAGFYGVGAGPMLDVGVYALTVLTSILGPVKQVTGFGRIVLPDRVIAQGPKAGTRFKVLTPDQLVGGLEFASGALGRITASFVVGGTRQISGSEFHGETGSLVLHSNHAFNGAVERYDQETREWETVPPVRPPFEGVEWGRAVFDLADSLRKGTPQHCTGRQALHVLDICLGIIESAKTGRRVKLRTTFDPAPMLP